MKGRNKRDNKAKYLLILLLLIAVGYAAIATTLKINGTSTIKSAKWDVYWENPQVLSGSVTSTAPTLSESDTKATFNVTLNEPGDYYEFTIDAVNNGSLDAKIDTNGIVKQVKNASGEVVTPTILKYEVTNNDQEHTAIQEGHILAKKSGNTPTKETYRVRVEYRNDEGINPSDLDDNDLVFTIEFSVKYVQGPKAEPAPDPYSMEAICPGCVFAQNSDSQSIKSELSVETTEDYTDFINPDDDYTLFLGYVVGKDSELADENGDDPDTIYVLRGFTCGITNDDKVICLEGGIDEADLDEKPVYQRNIDILNHFAPNCNADSNNDSNSCNGYTAFESGADKTGRVYHGTNSGLECKIDNGEAQCQ